MPGDSLGPVDSQDAGEFAGIPMASNGFLNASEDAGEFNNF